MPLSFCRLRSLSSFVVICSFVLCLFVRMFTSALFVLFPSRPHPGPGPGPTPRPEARPGGSKKGFLGGPKRGFPGGFRDPKRATGGILPTGSLAKNRVFRGFFRGFWGYFWGFLDPRRTSGRGVGRGGGSRGWLTGVQYKSQLVPFLRRSNRQLKETVRQAAQLSPSCF